MRITGTVYAITAAVVVGSTVVTYVAGNRVMQLHGREQQRRTAVSALDDLLVTMEDAETGQRGYLLTSDDKYLEPFNAAETRLQSDLARVRELHNVGISPAGLQRLNELTTDKLAELRQTIQLLRDAGLDAALSVVRSGRGQQLMDQVRDTISRMKDDQQAAIEREVRASDAATHARTGIFITAAGLNLLVLLWGFLRIRDAIEERNRAVREWRQQRDLLSTTLASIGDCVIVTDPRGTITFMNGVAESVTGWRLEEARHRPVQEVFKIINEDTREAVEDPVAKVIKHGVIVGLANHTLLIRKDGSQVPIDDSGAPIRTANGRLEGVVLVFRDFSTYKETQRELRQAKEAAEAANKTKDKFLAMLSHELRTPLTPVLATLNRWEISDEVPADLHSDVRMLRRNVELEARIIDDLLDLTRIAHGVLTFSPEVVDVHALIQMLLKVVGPEAEAKHLTITTQLEATRHFVHTDSARLQQVLWNILRNAINFTDTGGNIVIITGDSDNKVAIRVTDTGVGMSQETLSRLFSPFEQADRTRSVRYGGLGLGMAISHGLVELMGGKLTAQSEGLGRGSTFTLSLQTVDEKNWSAAPASIAPATHTARNILLVEDHIDTSIALARLLRNRGHRVETAETVRAAVDALNNNHFDLLLCDVALPDGTGYDVIAASRQRNRMPAIAITGHGMTSDVDKALAAGFDAHLTKPIEFRKLETAIANLPRSQGKS